ncbi:MULTISPECIES: hypothetical protein [unclassified Mycobacterium]|uniref:hypothetical protein n=1 Tax=unclassified Mycobacterium TaxID=2642494 RepID=UPI00342ACC2E
MTAVSTTTSDSLLRFAMRADAIPVGVVGIVFAAAAQPLSPVLGLPVAAAYGLAAFFIAWGVIVTWLASRPAVRAAGIGAAIANVICTVGAVAVVLTDVWPLTTLGVVMMLASGVYTAVFAELQYVGVKRIAA